MVLLSLSYLLHFFFVFCLLSVCLLTNVCCLLSAACCLLSAVCCLLSAVCRLYTHNSLQVGAGGD
jgi:hypothetical protein